MNTLVHKQTYPPVDVVGTCDQVHTRVHHAVVTGGPYVLQLTILIDPLPRGVDILSYPPRSLVLGVAKRACKDMKIYTGIAQEGAEGEDLLDNMAFHPLIAAYSDALLGTSFATRILLDKGVCDAQPGWQGAAVQCERHFSPPVLLTEPSSDRV